MRSAMRNRKRLRTTTTFSPATLSTWGQRVMWIRAEFQLSYRDIAQETGLDKMAISKMVHNPQYVPFHDDGQVFLRWYRNRQRESRLRFQPPSKQAEPA